jgi:amidase
MYSGDAGANCCHNPFFNTAPFDATGHPAISVNAGFSADALPIGLMAIGRHFEDGMVLRVAHAIEKLVTS